MDACWWRIAASLFLLLCDRVESELLGCQSSSCYHFFYSNRSWNESRSECIKLGGDLAVINDQDTHDFVSKKLFELLPGEPAAGEVWLGATGVELDNWYWENGSILAFSRWTTGYPENNMYAAEFNESSYHWKDQTSPFSYRFLCDGTTELCNKVPNGYIKISPPPSRLCILAYVGTTIISWHKSQSKCTELGTTLATVDDENIFMAIQHELNKTEYRFGAYWIGLHKEQWTWVDATKVIFSKWDPASPDQTSSCMSMYHISSQPGNYLWQDSTCNKQKPYLCQLPPETTVSSETTAISFFTTSNAGVTVSSYSQTVTTRSPETESTRTHNTASSVSPGTVYTLTTESGSTHTTGTGPPHGSSSTLVEGTGSTPTQVTYSIPTAITPGSLSTLETGNTPTVATSATLTHGIVPTPTTDTINTPTSRTGTTLTESTGATQSQVTDTTLPEGPGTQESATTPSQSTGTTSTSKSIPGTQESVTTQVTSRITVDRTGATLTEVKGTTLTQEIGSTRTQRTTTTTTGRTGSINTLGTPTTLTHGTGITTTHGTGTTTTPTTSINQKQETGTTDTVNASLPLTGTTALITGITASEITTTKRTTQGITVPSNTTSQALSDQPTTTTTSDDTKNTVTAIEATTIPGDISALSAAQIAGITIGTTAALVIIIIIIICCWSHRHKTSSENSYIVSADGSTVGRYTNGDISKIENNFSFVNPVYVEDQKSISSDFAVTPANNVIDFNPLYSTAVKPFINDKRSNYFDVNSKLQTPFEDGSHDINGHEKMSKETDDDIHSLPGTDAALHKPSDDDTYSSVVSPNRTVLTVTSEPEVDLQLADSLEDESVFVTTIVLPP